MKLLFIFVSALVISSAFALPLGLDDPKFDDRAKADDGRILGGKLATCVVTKTITGLIGSAVRGARNYDPFGGGYNSYGGGMGYRSRPSVNTANQHSTAISGDRGVSIASGSANSGRAGRFYNYFDGSGFDSGYGNDFGYTNNAFQESNSYSEDNGVSISSEEDKAGRSVKDVVENPIEAIKGIFKA